MRGGTAKLASLIASLLVLACSRSEPPPNVILLTLDTLRADHLGCYGYARPTSPQLDAFAQTATLYRRAYATSPWTLPSHASLFTGRHPAEHGAHTFKQPTGRAVEGVLASEHTTLAEALRAEGYSTAAFVGNAVYLKPRFQLDQGFDHYYNERTYARTLTRFVVAWLAEQRESQPFFLFANYIDTHNPYNAGKRRGDPGFLGEDDDRQSYELFDELRPHVLQRLKPFPDEKVALLIDQYDTAISNMDAELGFLFRELERLGLYDRSLIVLTSDHGEFFGEHDLIDHGKDVYEPVLRVPLIVKSPGQREGRSDSTLVSGADVANLIFAQLPRAIALRNLPQFPNAPGKGAVIAESYFTMPYDFNRNAWERARFDRVRRVIYDWPYKYIHDSTGRHELYDLEADPQELDDRSTAQERVAQRLAGELLRAAAANAGAPSPVPARAPSPDEIENLRALGYLPRE